MTSALKSWSDRNRRHIPITVMIEAKEEGEKVDDPATEDVYTEILRETELDMWFLESHINV